MKYFITACLVIAQLQLYAQKNYDFPPEINLVLDYLLKEDYPEVINAQNLKLRPVRWAIFDVDNDGNTEVFLQILPHYMQSPAILVFSIFEKDSVVSITEALAPGRMVPVYKKELFIDTHTTGVAADLQIENTDREKLKAIVNASLKFGLSVIVFKNFIHTEKRDSKPFFVDATHLYYPNKANACTDWQIALPQSIAAGKVKGRKKNVFIAFSEGEFFCYEISAIHEGKYIEKHLSILPAPKLFSHFEMERDQIKYRDAMGNLHDLKLK
ncbi:MAG TPA: hypothetical protein PKC24_14925 [Cyclobacteriaceae bacterium]|nr:hypothetical protein [Cyclobacteriaceae bacterium]